MIIRTQHTSLLSILALALASKCSAEITSAPAAQTISIGTEEFVVDPNNVILDGISISAGGPVITINNEPVSMDVADDLFVGATEVLTGHVAKVNVTSSASSQKTATNSIGAGPLSSSMWKEGSSSAAPQDNLNTDGLEGFLEFLQSPSGTSQAESLLNSTTQSVPRSSSNVFPSGAFETSQTSSLLNPTAQSAPQSSAIAFPYESSGNPQENSPLGSSPQSGSQSSSTTSTSSLSVHGHAATLAPSSGTSLSASMLADSQSTPQSQIVTSSSVAIGLGERGRLTTGTKSSTSSLGNSTDGTSSSLIVSSSGSTATLALAASSKSGITISAPATSSMPISSSQPNVAAASSSVLILAGVLSSLSVEGKSLSGEIT